MKKLLGFVLLIGMLAGCCKEECCKNGPIKVETLFEGKYATGYVVVAPVDKKYGLLEMSSGGHHPQSYLAFFDSLITDYSPEKQHYVRVNHIEGIPKVVGVMTNIDETKLFGGVPITNLDYHHVLSDHGRDAKWHKKGHRVKGGFVDAMLKIEVFEDTVAYIVPEALSAMAQALSDETGNNSVYYDLDSDSTKFIELDSVHRHGNNEYDW